MTPTTRTTRNLKPERLNDMQGPKTHEKQMRILERKPDMPDVGTPPSAHPRHNPGARQSEFPISRQGMNQESDHNKHNEDGQSGHKPQTHTKAEEKQD
jgi:hypothetical protein